MMPTSLIPDSTQVARTSRDGQFDLVWRPHAEERFFQTNAESHRFLRAKTAMFGSNACLYGAQRFAIGVAETSPLLTQFSPDLRLVALHDAKQVDALPAGEFDRWDSEFFCHIGNRSQLRRVGQTAPHPGNHAEGAIFLDVGMGPFVDEAGLGVVLRFVGPGGDQIVVEGGATSGATV